MKSTAQIGGHPLHPMLIPYPFALLSSALVFDVGAAAGRRGWSRTAQHLTTAGLASAAVAAIPGIVDYFGTVPPGTQAKRSATIHALANASALVCFAVAHGNRDGDGRLPDASLGLAVLGAGLLGIGGWLGGQLVYHEHIGVADEDGVTGSVTELEESTVVVPSEPLQSDRS